MHLQLVQTVNDGKNQCAGVTQLFQQGGVETKGIVSQLGFWNFHEKQITACNHCSFGLQYKVKTMKQTGLLIRTMFCIPKFKKIILPNF